MAEPTIQLGGGNWAGKTDNLLGYYKEGERFYKQDFTFSRSTTGTYTDSDGYIQEMPYNKLLQSNTFNTSWSNSGTTETSGQSGYDGTNNAWLLEKSQSDGYIYQNITQSNTQTISVYAKSGSIGGIQIYINAGTTRFQSYNLDNGTLIGTGNGENSSIENVGGGWYRCIFTINDSATRIRLYPTTNTGDKSGTSGSIYIQNAQLVKGSSAKTYFPTTTRLNIPRVDYLNNSNGSLILEPQRTNLVTHSSDFSGGWSLDDATKVSNSTASPDGTVNAITLIGNTNASRHHISKVAAGSVTASLSVFAKAKELRYLQIASANTTSQYVNFDVSDGTIGTVGSSFTDAKIEDYGNGWYRCSVTSTNQYNNMYISLVSSLTSSWLESWTMSNNTDGLYLYGAQLEQGSYATSYIPTSGSSVTRNADACSLTNVADRINSSEGTIFVEMAALTNDSTNRYISINNGTSSKRIIFKFGTSSNNISALGLGTASSFNMSYSDATITNMNKIALKYKENDCALWINGVEVATDSTFTAYAANTLNKITFSNFAETGQFLEANVKNFMLYNTALSDTELTTLTTL